MQTASPGEEDDLLITYSTCISEPFDVASWVFIVLINIHAVAIGLYFFERYTPANPAFTVHRERSPGNLDNHLHGVVGLICVYCLASFGRVFTALSGSIAMFLKPCP